MFPLNWNIPIIRKNGSRTTLGAITGDIAGIEEDITSINNQITDISTIRTNATNAYAGILKLAEHEIGDNADVTIPNMNGVWLAIMSRTNATSCGVYLLVIHSNGTSNAILPIAPVQNTDFSISISGTSVKVQTGTSTSGRIRFLRITDSNY